MKKRIVTIVAVCLLFVGTVIVMRAQQDQQEQAKPSPQQAKPSKPESKPSEGKPEPGEQAKPGEQQKEKRQMDDQSRVQQEQQRQLEDEQKRVQREHQKQTDEQQKHAKQEQQEQTSEHRRGAQDDDNDQQNHPHEAQGRGSRSVSPQRGVRIPDDRFREHFGRNHTFRVERIVLVENRPRFQYTGYWFELIDPWPAGWSYADDCYIDYIDEEYFLIDPLHPGIRVAVFVVE